MVSRKRERKPSKTDAAVQKLSHLPNIKKSKKKNAARKPNKESINSLATATTASEQLDFFLQQYQSANAVQLSSLELDSLSDACIIKLSESLIQDASTLGEHMKTSFGPSWKEDLCRKQPPEGRSEPGSPALLTISLSALRSLELLRGLRSLTRECHAAKLFSKHMKVEEQVSILKDHVNIACGMPSRIKKLIDMEALGLSRLAVVVLDMQTDVKGYSLFTLPQVRDEFWDLYKSYFHQRLLQGDLRLCLYGTLPVGAQLKKKVADD